MASQNGTKQAERGSTELWSDDLKRIYFIFFYFKGQGKQKGTSKYIPGPTNPTKNL